MLEALDFALRRLFSLIRSVSLSRLCHPTSRYIHSATFNSTMKMEIGAMALCSLSAATAFVAPSAFHGSQLARPQQATSGACVSPSLSFVAYKQQQCVMSGLKHEMVYVVRRSPRHKSLRMRVDRACCGVVRTELPKKWC